MTEVTSAETVQLDRHTYEDPFLDMAASKLPKSFKKLLELCQIFALTHPQISPIIQRLAEYPITSLVYKAADQETVRRHRELFEQHLRILEKMVEWGLDYYAYGNCFVSISFPFVRMYRCKACGHDHQTHEVEYRIYGGRFEGFCKACQGTRELMPVDEYVRDSRGINLFRFEPQLMTPKYNRVTGRYFYYYDISPDIKRAVEIGDRDIIDTTPVEYLQCISLRRKLKVKRVYHFKRPTVSGRDMQWGFPLVLPALKDAYLNQIYKKADEAIALEHSVPLRILFPQAQTQDPLQKLALGSFKSFMNRNIRYWRRDKNAIITSPMPIGVTNIGGDKDLYSTINARIKVVDEIMGAMMVTRGFVMGGENWSSASISQRIMENSFLNYLKRLDGCLQWIRDEAAAFLGLPSCQVSMKPFKKVDDVQMLQLILQLAREKKVSWNEALSRMDLDSRTELETIENELKGYTQVMLEELMGQNEANAKALLLQTVAQQETEGIQTVYQNMVQRSDAIQAEVQGTATKDEAAQAQAEEQQQAQQQDPQAQMMMAKAQRDNAQGQKDEALAQRYQGQNMDMGKQIAMWANELLSAPATERKRLLAQMHQQAPELAQAVVEVAQQLESQGAQSAQQLVQSLIQTSKSGEELAKKMQLLEPGQQQAALRYIQRTNPKLFSVVMQTLSQQNMMQQQGGGGQVVDMRPLPDQRPPVRKESPV